MIPSPPSPLRLYSSLPSPLSTALAAHSPSPLSSARITAAAASRSPPSLPVVPGPQLPRRLGAQISSFPESSPLHLAARGGSLDCVRELLAWGADRLQRDSSGRIPYTVALKHKHNACAAQA
ncbi:hypothetical protein Scep_015845 [Stephania cephalantha]|uniref:Uncharacterized protein n=1 Tax=Stephania cephalantha TaxID=152367 RepID=A0AAP0P1V5_9MAGN